MNPITTVTTIMAFAIMIAFIWDDFNDN